MTRLRAILGTRLLLLTAICLGVALSGVAYATTPSNLVYEGRLLDDDRVPVTTAVTIRFSFWKSGDWVSSDTTGAGAVNTSATNYGGWFETQTVTPDAHGIISLRLGAVSALPTIVFTNHKYLQVEVKASGAADTSYQLMDPSADAGADADDRQFVGSVPYAKVAESLQNKTPGTASGSIPVLQSGGLLPISAVPGGTNRDLFTLDFDNTASTGATLRFGNSIGAALSYDVASSRFNFNDDVRIQGNLTVTGLINGVDLQALSSDSKLRVSSGAGLFINVAAGGYRLNGVAADFADASNVAVAANATSNVFIGSGGLTVRTMGFPTDESFIRLATVVTNGTGITSLTDKRIVQSDDREELTEIFLHAGFPNASYQGDATDNIGQLSISLDNISLKNFYLWTSTRSSLQDYDVAVRVTLPSDFVRWDSSPLAVAYRTTSADVANSKLDISLFDTNGSPVTLAGGATGLASTSWATANLTYGGTPTWTAGQEFLIKVKFYAKGDFQAHLGSIRLKYERLMNP